MFEVNNVDDAWELGVLHADGLIPVEVVAFERANLIEAFDDGVRDHKNLNPSRVAEFASGWLV